MILGSNEQMNGGSSGLLEGRLYRLEETPTESAATRCRRHEELRHERVRPSKLEIVVERCDNVSNKATFSRLCNQHNPESWITHQPAQRRPHALWAPRDVFELIERLHQPKKRCFVRQAGAPNLRHPLRTGVGLQHDATRLRWTRAAGFAVYALHGHQVYQLIRFPRRSRLQQLEASALSASPNDKALS